METGKRCLMISQTLSGAVGLSPVRDKFGMLDVRYSIWPEAEAAEDAYLKLLDDLKKKLGKEGGDNLNRLDSIVCSRMVICEDITMGIGIILGLRLAGVDSESAARIAALFLAE